MGAAAAKKAEAAGKAKADAAKKKAGDDKAAAAKKAEGAKKAAADKAKAKEDGAAKKADAAKAKAAGDAAGGAIFITPDPMIASGYPDDGTGVVVAQLVLVPGEYNMTFNMQGYLVQDPDGNDCTLPKSTWTASMFESCMWIALQQSVVFTAEVNDVCPYDSRPAVGSDGTCTPSSSLPGHDGCPDNFINAQDLLALLGQIATTLEDEGSDFAGYPIDASPVPGCYYESGQQVCYDNYGDGLINVHDLLALLGLYGRDYAITPCSV